MDDAPFLSTATGDTITMAPSGELDAAAAQRFDGDLRAALFTSEARTLVIDLGEVTFVDSTALGVIVGAHKLMRERGGHLVVRRPNGMVQRLLEVTRLGGELTIEA